MREILNILNQSKDHPWSNININDQQLELLFSKQTAPDPTNPKNDIAQEDKKNLLGQIFTPPDLAKFMVSLLKSNLKANHLILDPCIGPNTFFSYLTDIPLSIKITGVELDTSLITESIKEFYLLKNRELVLDSFFNIPLSRKFDHIIQNPPYVRQELLMYGDNSKSLLLRSLAPLSKIIPAKSNLYVYFILKSIFHLTDRGRLIVVIYDSWLYSDFGEVLKEAFVRFGSIEGIYHFKKNVFPDADIGATVIDFRRNLIPKLKIKPIKIYSIKSIEEAGLHDDKLNVPYKNIPIRNFFTYRFNEETIIDFNNVLFHPIEKIVSQPIIRGIASIANKYFIHQEKTFEESIPFIKDVTSINTFKISNEFSYLLALNGNLSERTRLHLDFVKREILADAKKFRALQTQIESNNNWYKVQLKKPGNILFNYYLRKNIDFLLNEELNYSSDNFYILNVEKNILAFLAVLNSSFTRISILHHSRNQGNGLRKIQLYEFKKIPVFDIREFSKETILRLERAGEKLKLVKRYTGDRQDMIREIDKLLIIEYNLRNKVQISYAQLIQDLQNIS